MMTMSTAGIAFLKGWETCRLDEYLDQKGNPTIGWGHKLLPGEHYPYGISQAVADQLLQEDLLPHEAYVSQFNVPMSQLQFDALCDLSYNEGSFGPHLSVALRNQDWPGICAVMLTYDHEGSAVSPGLLKRRQAEVRIIETGVYDATH